MGKEIKKIVDEFKNPGSVYRGAPFWAWNGKLEKNELRRQVRIMKEMGLGGFFMHSRVGLDTHYLSKEWFECIETSVDEAKKLNMLAYLYDEDRWPSGAAGGIVTKNPEFRMKELHMKMTENVKEINFEKNVLAIFVVEFENQCIKKYRRIKKNEKLKDFSPDEKILIFSLQTQEPSPWYNGYTYLDTMNPEAVKEFIKVTHEQYKKYVGKNFGSIVPGIFTDEPNYGGIQYKENIVSLPWTEKVPETFKKRYGYDILQYLPEVCFNIIGNEISKVRYHYFDCVTHLFVSSFSKQIGNWCKENKILFTGHILSEDTLSSQTRVVGNCMRFYEYMQAPGMDLLTEYWRIFNTAKQVSSIARQFGKKWRLTETYGCTGWDFPFSGHKALGDWQIALGINLRCQHLSWYTMLGQAKRDYPASIFYQSPWWDIYKKVEDYFSRINSIMTNGEEVRDLLVIHPIESMWAIYRMKWNMDKSEWENHEDVVKYNEMFIELCDELLSSHIDFDYGDEEIMSRWAKITKKDGEAILKINKGEYKAVLVPPLYTIRSSTLKILEEFKKNRGEVIFIKNFPSYVDGERKSFDFSTFEVIPSLAEGIKKTEKKARKISIIDKNGDEIKEILYLLREDKNFYYLFLSNTSVKWEKDIFKTPPVRERNIEFNNARIKGFPPFKYPPVELDPDKGEIYSAETTKTHSGYEIRTSFKPIESRLFLIPKKELAIEVKERNRLKEIEKIRIKEKNWYIKLTEPNVLVLDTPLFKIGDNAWQEKKDILKVDDFVRKYLGISQRGGRMVQPWARKKEKKSKSVNVSLKYLFNVEKIPSGGIDLAIEKPELYKIYINGYRISRDMENGWWVDKSLKKIKFDPSILFTGKNEIILETLYNENHPGFEIIYVLGNFGVRIEGKEVFMTELPEKLEIGDLTGKGFPFYSGNVNYIKKLSVEIKENQKVFVKVPEYGGVSARIFVDGKEGGIIAWPPNEIDITDFIKGKGNFTLGIEIMGHRRNSHGPLHYFEKWPIWTGSAQFVAEGSKFYEGYQIVPTGLLKSPEIVLYEKI